VVVKPRAFAEEIFARSCEHDSLGRVRVDCPASKNFEQKKKALCARTRGASREESGKTARHVNDKTDYPVKRRRRACVWERNDTIREGEPLSNRWKKGKNGRLKRKGDGRTLREKGFPNEIETREVDNGQRQKDTGKEVLRRAETGMRVSSK